MTIFARKRITSLAKPLSLTELRKRVKIVVIDDDEHAFPTKTLQDEGYTIEHWPEVKSLDRLERGDFDIIVLDIAGVAGRFARYCQILWTGRDQAASFLSPSTN